MSAYMIERRYGRCNRDWLCDLTEHATVWSRKQRHGLWLETRR